MNRIFNTVCLHALSVFNFHISFARRIQFSLKLLEIPSNASRSFEHSLKRICITWLLKLAQETRTIRHGPNWILLLRTATIILRTKMACRIEWMGKDFVYVSGRKRAVGEMNGKSANLNNCLSQIYPPGIYIPASELVCIFDADQVRLTPEFNALMSWGP